MIPFSASIYSCVKYPHFRDGLPSNVGSNGKPSISAMHTHELIMYPNEGCRRLIPVVAVRFFFKIFILLARHSDGVDVTGS